MRTITLHELKRLLDAGQPVILVEVLAAHAYRKAHLPNAVNLPVSDLRRTAERALPDKAATIVVYCQNPRCGSAAKAEIGRASCRERV